MPAFGRTARTDLRHQTAINLTRAGVPLADVQKWLGHSSLRMTMRYSAHSPQNSGEAALAQLEQRLVGEAATKTGTEHSWSSPHRFPRIPLGETVRLDSVCPSVHPVLIQTGRTESWVTRGGLVAKAWGREV